MASLVAEIISSAAKLEKEEIEDKVEKLGKHVDDVKLKIFEIIEAQYKDFTPNVTNATYLAKELDDMSNEVTDLTTKINQEIKGQLVEDYHKFHDLQDQLKESTEHTRLLSQFLNIYTNLENVENCFEKLDYLGSAEAILNVKVLLGELSHDCDDKIDILQAIRTEYLVKREKLIYDLSEIWNQHLLWEIPQKKQQKEEVIVFKLKTSDESIDRISSLINAMHCLGNLKVKLKAFADKFIIYMVQPMIKHTVDIVSIKNEDSISISLHVKSTEDKIHPTQVFENLTIMFKYFYNSFLILKVKDVGDPTIEDQSLMEIFGELISERFCSYIIQNCLSEAIPRSSKSLDDFVPIVEASEEFQSVLIDHGFLKPGNEAISLYTQNINVLFVNKICKDVLKQAREIMKKELFATAVIGVSNKNDDSSDEVTLKDRLEPENKLENFFRFPKCQISLSSEELLTLVNEILDEASISSTVCAARLFYISRCVFELYCDVVPTYHKENLETLPHVTAIHHNNCMYLAHHLQTLGHKFKRKLPESAANAHITYVDLVSRLRKIGTEAFLNQMHRQKSLFLESLKEAEGFQNMATDQNFSTTVEKAVKQCLHQFKSLKRVWSEVLPYNVYLKALGTLVNSWIEYLVFSIASQEDIPADNIFLLLSSFGIISNEAPTLFELTDSEEKSNQIIQYVQTWPKFQELIVVLGASLQELLDRWCAGKGPLASHFSADEVKQLIRALFQNTDRRAWVLAKIRK